MAIALLLQLDDLRFFAFVSTIMISRLKDHMSKSIPK